MNFGAFNMLRDGFNFQRDCMFFKVTFRIIIVEKNRMKSYGGKVIRKEYLSLDSYFSEMVIDVIMVSLCLTLNIFLNFS